ncbi:hypothetical protein ACFPES_24985 [Paenibacillus sp. GCM10023248]|uniref:hypothetical protein n=1 Tax=unclassified Paenibacillus TaxID=185978 RepID=UPI002378D6BA|nr:hypothetical protein [Paenibacillus sp. MAHUQ-63]MDD9270315.1 hypothetical protein [Paenibacillus sp. MAHUQ-63]
MFRNRTFLVGIGTGVIVGALLLQVMSVRSGVPGGSGLTLDEMDPQKLKEEASKYYQVYDKNTKMYTQAELDASVGQKVKEATEGLAAAKPTEQPKVETVHRTVIYVQPNLDATAVAELLVKSGLITDRKAFADELAKQGGNTKLQVGFHVFEGQMDMKQVVTNLLTQQQ